MNVSHVRSFVFSGQCNPAIALCKFKFVRVLNLEVMECSQNSSLDLTAICKLFQLMYLKISSKVHVQLPAQIRGLQHLETQQVEGKLNGIPSDIIHLPQMSHLIVPAGTRLTDGIGSMSSLRTLKVFEVGNNSMDSLKGLGEPASLRSLYLWCIREECIKQPGLWDAFWSSIANLASRSLRGLTLFAPLSLPTWDDGSSHLTSLSCNLQRLDAQQWLFCRIPRWAGQLQKLQRLELTVNNLYEDDFDVLAALPALLYLRLRARRPPKRWISVDSTGFPLLKDFFMCCVPRLGFVAGAMAKLQSFHLTFHAHGAVSYGPVLDIAAGLNRLLSREHFSATIGTGGAEEVEKTIAECALQRAFSKHPGRPHVNIQSMDALTFDLFDVPDDGSNDDDGGSADLEQMSCSE